ncbi:MAG: hypothetical protein AAF468_14995 [Pseudomonadota bacterium]
MIRSLIAASVIAAGFSAPVFVSQASAQSASWFAIGGCFQSYRAANRRAAQLGVDVADTNDYPNFRDGWYCAVSGPSSKRNAQRTQRYFKNQGIHDAYIKRGW